MNGRRAWRRFVRNARRLCRHDGSGLLWYLLPEGYETPIRAFYYGPATDLGRAVAFARRHAVLLKAAPSPMQPKPFTARSLVGMSMGARKRAARVECMAGDLLAEQPRRVWMLWWEGRARHYADLGPPDGYHEARLKYRIGERLRPCPGCAECLSEAQIRARVEKARQVRFWGQTYTVTPALVPTIFGDGKAWLHFEPLNTRPDFYVVRIGSDIDGDGLYEILDDIYAAISEEWGDTQSYECTCTPTVKYCDDCRPEFPALNDDCGAGWGWATPYLPDERCSGHGTLPARASIVRREG